MSRIRGRRPVDWRPRFLEAYAKSGNVLASAQAAGVTRQWVYRYANAHPEFADAWHEAEQDAIDVLEAAARTRALSGSDTLIIFLLKALRPEKYRERVDVNVLREEARQIAAASGLDDADTEGLVDRAEQIARRLA